MTTVSRRKFFGFTAAGAALVAGAKVGAADSGTAALSSLTKNAQPIPAQEHAARIAKLQSLMQRQKVAAFLVESGTTLEYFTGIRWRRSERTTAALIPAEGASIVVTPFFEAPSIRELLKVPADVRTWNEDESPFTLIADVIIDMLNKLLSAGRQVVSGEALANACRMLKSAAELALMQAANDVTIAALGNVRARIGKGMSGTDIMQMMVEATEALGGKHEFSLVLLNEASAYPHGTEKPQTIREGSVVLIDTGCSVHGYQSDISRSWIFGEPSARQREVWNTVKRGQEITLETAKIGSPVGLVDKAVRKYYEGLGWSRDYGLPGTSHRTGHGIGMDVHEAPYLMRADTTPLEAGMCFSDEPGIYMPGEFGIRMEDCWYMSAAGPRLFTPLAKSIEDPI
jgi:Xaa-Pro dipeptidase